MTAIGRGVPEPEAIRQDAESDAALPLLDRLACISHQFGVTAEGRGFNPSEKRHFDSIPSHALGSSSRRTAERVKIQEGRRRLVTAGLKPRPSGRAGEKSGLANRKRERIERSEVIQ